MSANDQTPTLSTVDSGLTDRSAAADKEVDMTQVAANAEKKEKASKPKKEKKEKPAQQPKAQQQKKKVDEGSALIGITTTKEEDLADWYQQVLLKGEFLEYSDIPGCFILNVRHQVWLFTNAWLTRPNSLHHMLSGKRFVITSMQRSRR